MPWQNPSQPNKRFATLEVELIAPPSGEETVASFHKTMESVTKATENRILLTPHKEESIISPFLMKLQTKVSLAAGTLVVVLLVGYMTFNRDNSYQSLEESLLEPESAYDFSSDEDSFSDLDEEFRSDPTEDLESDEGLGNGGETTVPPSPTNTKTPTPTPTPTATVDVTADLAAIDLMFADDDIDDSGLEDWYSDVSAAEELNNQKYDF